MLVNSRDPEGAAAQATAEEIQRRCGAKCVCVNCQELGDEDVTGLMRDLLYEFPLQELDLFLPAWVDALPVDHPIRSNLYQTIRDQTTELRHIRQLDGCITNMAQEENVGSARLRSIDLGTGVAAAEIAMPRKLFYQTLSERSGLHVTDDGDLMEQLTALAAVKQQYDKVSVALRDAKETGYGIVMPGVDELILEDPEIVRQGGRYGVRMKASAPSIHMIRADIETTVSPIVGNEKQSEDMVNYLLQEFEGDTSKIWQSNIFGRSFHEIVGDDLQAKLKRMPEDAQKKMREALERIINEGGAGLICIIL